MPRGSRRTPRPSSLETNPTIRLTERRVTRSSSTNITVSSAEEVENSSRRANDMKRRSKSQQLKASAMESMYTRRARKTPQRYNPDVKNPTPDMPLRRSSRRSRGMVEENGGSDSFGDEKEIPEDHIRPRRKSRGRPRKIRKESYGAAPEGEPESEDEEISEQPSDGISSRPRRTRKKPQIFVSHDDSTKSTRRVSRRSFTEDLDSKEPEMSQFASDFYFNRPRRERRPVVHFNPTGGDDTRGEESETRKRKRLKSPPRVQYVREYSKPQRSGNSRYSLRGAANMDGNEEEEDDDDEDEDEDEDDNEKELGIALTRSRRKRSTPKTFYSDYLKDDVPEKRETRSSRSRHHPKRRRRQVQHYGGESDGQLDEDNTSSDSSEAAFDKRETRRLQRERLKINPINMEMHELSSLRLHGYKSQRSSGPPADADPANVDLKVTWESIGGLDQHICALKEMVSLPLLYPELFSKFNVSPPRGVIFYGPPGTGKTLVARALASTCSRHGKKVSFFMRKGADCLSKWVGEAERQLRLLFEQARRLQPSIIFFDEIDGLAPVRSSRQDQIHSSIVSTLLALMDGLDNRGQVIVVGATNRIDAIDPALRRPGRFDRELRFGLPNRDARRQILKIHTKTWVPSPSSEDLSILADKSSGYCGADLKALCTEASLEALRRVYPQVYTSDKKLKIDPKLVSVNNNDFERALAKIVPSSKRSKTSCARLLPQHMEPLLRQSLDCITNMISEVPGDGKLDFRLKKRTPFLIHGDPNLGQSYIGPALLQAMESIPSYSIDLPQLLSDLSSRSAEEALTRKFTECRSQSRAIIYWPHLDLWWETASASLRATVLMLMHDLPSNFPIAILAIADSRLDELPETLRQLFDCKSAVVHELKQPKILQRKAFFDGLMQEALKPLPVAEKPVLLEVHEATRESEEEAPQAVEVGPEAHLLEKFSDDDKIVICKLRMFLRSVIERLMKYFKIFIEHSDAPDYRRIILNPISLEDIRDNINSDKYWTIGQFLTDIDLLVSNTKEYHFPDKQMTRIVINKACHLQDSAFSMVCQFPKKLEQRCKELYHAKQRAEEAGTTKEAEQDEKEDEQEQNPSNLAHSDTGIQNAEVEVEIDVDHKCDEKIESLEVSDAANQQSESPEIILEKPKLEALFHGNLLEGTGSLHLRDLEHLYLDILLKIQTYTSKRQRSGLIKEVEEVISRWI